MSRASKKGFVMESKVDEARLLAKRESSSRFRIFDASGGACQLPAACACVGALESPCPT